MALELKLPDLRIVPLSRIVLHEESDPSRVERIRDRLLEDNILGNPPIVAEVKGTRRLVLLDGANRVSAAALLKLEALMVQVVEYSDPAVRLTRWHHLLIDFDPDLLVDCLVKIPEARVETVKLAAGEEALARHRLACLVRLRKADVAYSVTAKAGTSDAFVMRRVTDIYKRKTQIYRIADEQIDLFADRTQANVTAVVLFPGFRKSDIVRFALEEGEKLPPGITRHFIPNRALKVNLPLAVLRGPANLEARNRKLDDWIARKLRLKKIRAYPEPTVMFDE